MVLTDQRERAKNITDYRQNEKKITDYRHGPTLLIFVFRKKSILYFLEVTTVTLNFDSSDGLTERISVSLIHVHVYRYNQTQNHRSHTLRILPTLYILLKLGKGVKPNISCFDGRHKSLLKYTTKRGYLMSLQSV